MLGFSKQQRRFDLLYLEEGEQYVKDFTGSVHYFDVLSQDYREASATIHFCSRSLIIELDTDTPHPIYKYLFKFFTQEPDFIGGKHPLRLYLSKIVEVPLAPKPYK
jgi:hypothetical protein